MELHRIRKKIKNLVFDHLEDVFVLIMKRNVNMFFFLFLYVLRKAMAHSMITKYHTLNLTIV